MSAFDPIPFIVNSERHLTFVGKKELMKAPFIPAAMTVIEGDYMYTICLVEDEVLVSEIKHSATLKVDKKGIKGAAVTVIGFAKSLDGEPREEFYCTMINLMNYPIMKLITRLGEEHGDEWANNEN